jgi:hypothetical protein
MTRLLLALGDWLVARPIDSRVYQLARPSVVYLLPNWLLCLMGVLGALVLLSGCDNGEWYPTSYPVTVELAASLSPEQKLATLEAVDRWNDALGVTLLTAVETRSGPHDGRVYVGNDEPGKGAVASTWEMPAFALVYLGGCSAPAVVTHEIGHVLTLQHDELPGSVMLQYEDASGQILPEHVEQVRALMGMDE